MGLLDQALNLAFQGVGVALAHAKAAADRRPDAPPAGPARMELPALPRLDAAAMSSLARPALPTLASLQVPTLRTQAPAAGNPAPSSGAGIGAVAVASSYAAEWGEENLSVACAPCTRRHLSTMTLAAQKAAAAADPAQRRQEMAVALGEALVWTRYDVTAEKLARAKPHDQAAIAEAVPAVQAAIAPVPRAPDELVVAWAAVGEALRFATSAQPSDVDRREIALRMQDVDGLCGYLETTMAGRPETGTARGLMRQARHRWTGEGYKPEALAFAEANLKAAVLELMPEQDPAQLAEVADSLLLTRNRFYGRALRAG